MSGDPRHHQEPGNVPLFGTELFTVGEFRCPGCPPVTDPETAPFPEIVLPRKGSYIRRDASGAVYLDRTVTAFFEANRPYVIEHPRPRPDLTTVVSLTDQRQLADSLGIDFGGPTTFRRAAVRTTPALHLAHSALIRSLSHAGDRLRVEENAVTLISLAMALTQGSPELVRASDDREGRWRRGIAFATAEHLNANYRRALRLQDVAEHIGYSVFHLCRIFQSEMGKPIHQYLMELRLEAAMAELADPARPITDLAFELGFSSASHFTGQFTRWAGMPPREARRRIAKAESKISNAPGTASG